MKTFGIILLIIIVGGLGWYAYSTKEGDLTQNNAPTPTPPAPVSTAETHVVEITSTAFIPATLKIKTGDTIKFINKDTKAHWPASGPHPQHTLCPGFDSQVGLKAGESFSFTFTEAKTCPMHDHLNPAIRGSIIVEELPR